MILTDFASNVVALVRERVGVEFDVEPLTIDRDAPSWTLAARMGRTQLDLIRAWFDLDRSQGPQQLLLRLPEHHGHEPELFPCWVTRLSFRAVRPQRVAPATYEEIPLAERQHDTPGEVFPKRRLVRQTIDIYTVDIELRNLKPGSSRLSATA